VGWVWTRLESRKMPDCDALTSQLHLVVG